MVRFRLGGTLDTHVTFSSSRRTFGRWPFRTFGRCGSLLLISRLSPYRDELRVVLLPVPPGGDLDGPLRIVAGGAILNLRLCRRLDVRLRLDSLVALRLELE
jgi:hypothetical protein